MTGPLRVAAIDFLNPAPLMWNFEHPPAAAELATRYTITRMNPSDCARALKDGRADIGLVPIGAYAVMPELTLLPGSAIASLDAIRSLILVVRSDAEQRTDQEPDLVAPAHAELARIRSVALDTASRTSAIYTKLLFRKYWKCEPEFLQHSADLNGMLEKADAALLIGDPALFALRDRVARYHRTRQPLRYIDLGHLWRQATGCAWVSAVWAIRTEVLESLSENQRVRLVEDFTASGRAGVHHVPELASEWAPRLGLDRAVLERYLGHNIHYACDEPVLAGMRCFLADAYELQLIPALPELRWALALTPQGLHV